MDWDAVMSALRTVEEHIDSQEDNDHDPTEAIDPESGETYCLGCQVGATAQSLRVDIEDYLATRTAG